MKPTRASILSTTEEKFLLKQIAVLRKLQIKSLPDDKILHDFLSCVSSEKTLIAYEDTNNHISWNVSKGFIVDLEDSFFKSPENLQIAYEAVRSCFFENFLDEDDYAALGSESALQTTGRDLENESKLSDEITQEIETSEDDSDDELDLLSKVNDLDANTLSTDEVEIEADEFSNLSNQENSEITNDVAEEISNENTSEATDAEESSIASKEQKSDELETSEPAETPTANKSSEDITEEDVQSPKTTEENSDDSPVDLDNLSSDQEIINEVSEESDPEASTEAEDSEPSVETEAEIKEVTKNIDSESDSEGENTDTEGPDFDNLAKQLTDVGMETDKIDSLLSAVKSGKAPLETVQATIDKLKSASE
ncbi:MAG: hypothetical protein VX619_09120 [bacterium]|nr:hypothetical protein [bacterium]